MSNRKTILPSPDFFNLLGILRTHLHRYDPHYPEIEIACQNAVQSLKDALEPDTSRLLDIYIIERNSRPQACLSFLFQQVCPQNEACFRNLSQRHFLDLALTDGYCRSVQDYRECIPISNKNRWLRFDCQLPTAGKIPPGTC